MPYWYDIEEIIDIYWDTEQIDPFHKDFSPSGDQIELRKLHHKL